MRMNMVELQVEATGEGPNSQLGPMMDAGPDMGPTSVF